MPASYDEDNEDDDDEEEDEDELSGGDVRVPASRRALPTSIDELCRLTNLRNFDVSDVASLFLELSGSEYLKRGEFCSGFRILREGADLSPEDGAWAEHCVDALFDIFDADGNGLVVATPSPLSELRFLIVRRLKRLSNLCNFSLNNPSCLLCIGSHRTH